MKSLTLSPEGIRLKFRDPCALFYLMYYLQPFWIEFALGLSEFTVFFSLQPVWVFWP